ncbi:thioredoxin [Spiroplasma chinense]|uniref:Thioredoxin n=1 Tax=Spiroplasma chinense TaxID=216932 RepID=A0A5B9Y355_9MOLU|nr:thioredoxin [Spiroplasma chinense]QEH61391.1 thioredoxin [Spiroplasma chinense]
MAKIVETLEQFEQEVASGKTVVDFYADWCGPCKMLGPIFEQVSTETEGVNFIKVNTDLLPEVADRFEVRSIPTIIKLENGNEANRFVGLMGKDQLKTFAQ